MLFYFVCIFILIFSLSNQEIPLSPYHFSELTNHENNRRFLSKLKITKKYDDEKEEKEGKGIGIEKIFMELHEKNYDSLEIIIDDENDENENEVIKMNVNKEEMEILNSIEGFEIESMKMVGSGNVDKDRIPDFYKELNEINDFMRKIEKKNRRLETGILVKMMDLTLKYGVRTHDKNPIYAMKISSKNYAIKSNVLVVSCHHARETLTPMIAMEFIQDITTKYNREPYKTYLDEYVIYVIPVLNVDGYDYMRKYDRWWRKNRRRIDPFDKQYNIYDKVGEMFWLSEFVNTTEYGVDLNRNYETPSDWRLLGIDQGCLDDKTKITLQNPRSLVYRGPSPFSEPETFLLNKMEEDLHFSKVIDFHSYGQTVSMTTGNCFHFDNVTINMLMGYITELADLCDYRGILSFENYKVVGDHTSYTLRRLTSYSFLFETAKSFQPKEEDALAEVEKLVPVIYKWLDKQIPMQGYVQNILGAPLDVDISIKEITWYNSTFRRTARNGYYFLFIPNGTYTIIFSHLGFITHEKIVSYDEKTAIRYDFVMSYSSSFVTFAIVALCVLCLIGIFGWLLIFEYCLKKRKENLYRRLSVRAINLNQKLLA